MSVLGGRAVLVVDDDPAVGDIVSAGVARDGVSVVCAESLAQAHEALAGRRFDLVLLDLMLPDGDGRTLLARLRDDAAGARTPVFVLTARVAAQTRFACLAAGADGALEKPVDPGALLRAIRERLAAGERRVSPRRDPSTGMLRRAHAGGVAAAVRGDDDVSLALVSVDGFGWVSDAWGHDYGEALVGHVARALTTTVRADACVRWGCGELVAFGAGTAEALAQGVGDALARVRREAFRGPDGELLPVTFSAAAMRLAPGASVEAAVAEAERHVRAVRARGGGRVVTAGGATVKAIPMLLAEDTPALGRAVARRFSLAGFEVTWCEDGASAAEAAAREQFALVVTDLEMPGLDGFGLIERLRASADHATTPILLTTSMRTEDAVMRAFELGADDYVLKPCSADELLARATRLLRTSAAPPGMQGLP